MKTRIITAVVAVALLIPFLIFSYTPAFIVFTTLLSVVAGYEILSCVALKKNIPLSIATYLYAVIMSLSTRYHGYFEYHSIAMSLSFLLIFVSLAISVFSHGKVAVTESCVGAVFAVYAIFGLNSLVMLRDLNNGKYIYLMALLAPWLCDTFAYFGGSIFGKHKLIPDVSPKKTVEGAISGVVLGTAGVIVYALIAAKIGGIKANIPAVAIAAFILTFISQIGDLAASVIKRHYGIKDYGNLFPGHGGVLDRFDSVIACGGFLYILCLAFGSAFAMFS